MDPRPYHYQYRKPRYSNPTFQSGRLYESIYHMGSYIKMNPNLDKVTNNFVSPSQGNLNYNRQPAGERPARETNYNERAGGNDRYMQNYVQRQSKPEGYQNINNYESNRYSSLDRNGPQRQSNAGLRDQYQKQQYNDEGRQSVGLRHNGDSSQTVQFQPIRNSYDLRSIDPKTTRQPQVTQRKEPIRETPQPRSYSQDTRTTNSKPETQQGYMSNYGSRLMRAMPGKDQDFVYQRQQKPYNIISCYPKETPNSNTHRVYPKLTLESKLIEHGQYPLPLNNPQRY